MKEASALYRLLGDEARLRLLRVLARERLNVTELTGVLGPRAVGRLAPPRAAEGRRARGRGEGRRLHATTALAPRCATDAIEPRSGRRSRDAVRRRRPPMPAVRADEARLQEVLRLRKENFEAHAGADTRDARQLVPGRSWAAWSRALGLLLPPLAGRRSRLRRRLPDDRGGALGVAGDRRRSLGRRARARASALARRRRVANVIWKRGELEKLPIKDGAVDVALLSQALHHAREPGARGRRSGADHRARRPRAGPRSARRTSEEWVRAKLGDRTLGFDDDELKRMLAAAGLRDVKVGVGARKAGDPFTVLIASGTKPRDATQTPRRHEGTKRPVNRHARHDSTTCSRSASSSSTARWAR